MRKPPEMSFEDFLKLNDRFERGEITEEDVGDPNLQGRKSARGYLEKNVIRDEKAAREVQARALDFSDFQQTGLYDEEGLFEKVVDFQGTMPLVPQFLSPLFGKAIAEILFGAYVSSMYHHGPTPPTFLGLGAGRGYLDFDMIDHITGELFALMSQAEHPQFGEAVAKGSKFVVSDRTNRAVGYLQESLAPLIRERECFKKE